MSSPWPTVPAGQVAQIDIGGTPSRNNPSYWARDGSGHAWVSIADLSESVVVETTERISDLGVRCSNVKLVPAGTPMMSFKLTVGRTAVAGANLYTNEAIAAFHVRQDQVSARWLLHALPRSAARVVTDTAVKGVTLNKVKLQTIPLDLPPLPEQRRIAEILDTLDEAIRETEQVIAKLQQMKQGLLHDLLTCGIDENGELRDPERHPEQFQDSPLGRIPRSWTVDALVSRVDLPSGQVDPKREPFRSWVLVAPDHIEGATGRLLMKVTAGEQGAISGKYVFQAGDIVYSKIRPYLRKAMLANFDGLCSADMYPLRPTASLNSRYALAIILGEHFSRFASVVSMRSGFPKINREELAEYRCAFPPRDEQDETARILATLDERGAAEEAELAKLRTLKHGLIDDLLTGRVRVKTPPEDAS